LKSDAGILLITMEGYVPDNGVIQLFTMVYQNNGAWNISFKIEILILGLI